MYDDVWLSNRNTDLSGEFSSDYFEFIGSYSVGYVTKYEKIEVRFDFDNLSKSWKFAYIDNYDDYEEWDVLGKWTYSSEDANIAIIIHEINDDSISLEYDYTYTYDQVFYGETTQNVSSDGINKKEKVLFGVDGAIGCYLGGKSEEYLKIDKDSVTFGKVHFDSIKYELIYQGE